jgi:nucleoid-associated protein YgaU
MFCSDARRLLDEGVVPNTSDPQHTLLGFHLTGCASCRVYRKEIDQRRLLSAMLAQPLRAPAVRAVAMRRRSPAARPLRVAGAALVLGTALAMVPCSGLLPATATAAQAETTLPATNYSRRANVKKARPAHRQATQAGDAALLRDLLKRPTPDHRQAAQAGDAALLYDLLDRPTTPAKLRSENAAQLRVAAAELQVGQELSIPALDTSATTTSPAGIEAAPLQQTAQTYVVQPGDSLWAIAIRFYGNGGYWPTIYNANAGIIGGNPNLIYPNQRFTIPTTPTAGGVVPIPAPIQQRAGAPSGNYTIVSGDTLSGIALWAYGDANRWPELYNRNIGAIGGNPHLIFPGTVLNL